MCSFSLDDQLDESFSLAEAEIKKALVNLSDKRSVEI